MWLASIFPIAIGSIFVKFNLKDIDYLKILLGSIEADTIYAYVATMISPFIYLLAKFVTAKEDKRGVFKEIKFGGVIIVVSIVVAILISGAFTSLKSSPPDPKFNTMGFVSVGFLQAQGLPQESAQESPAIQCIWGLREWILMLCYLVALVIWYYTIYLNNLQPIDPIKEEKKRVKNLMDQVTDVVEG